MRAQIIIDISPAEPGTRFLIEVWDFDRDAHTRPLYTLGFVTAEETEVDMRTIVKQARHAAYVVYSRLGEELTWSPGPGRAH